MATQDIKTRKAYRQGELLFVPLDEADLAVISRERYGSAQSCWNRLSTNIIREGEATGHKHEVLEDSPGTATLLAPMGSFLEGLPNMDMISNEDRLLLAEQPVEVVHPEHRPLRLPKANYLIIVQREYDEVKARRILD